MTASKSIYISDRHSHSSLPQAGFHSSQARPCLLATMALAAVTLKNGFQYDRYGFFILLLFSFVFLYLLVKMTIFLYFRDLCVCKLCVRGLY